MSEPSQRHLFRVTRALRNEDEFRRWLERGEGLSQRSAADVVSRVKRALTFADIMAPLSDNELVFRLQECSAFRECSLSVRSQLKRAARLYREFRGLRNGEEVL